MAAQVARLETQMLKSMITRYGSQWQCPCPVEKDQVEVELGGRFGIPTEDFAKPEPTSPGLARD